MKYKEQKISSKLKKKASLIYLSSLDPYALQYLKTHDHHACEIHRLLTSTSSFDLHMAALSLPHERYCAVLFFAESGIHPFLPTFRWSTGLQRVKKHEATWPALEQTVLSPSTDHSPSSLYLSVHHWRNGTPCSWHTVTSSCAALEPYFIFIVCVYYDGNTAVKQHVDFFLI